MAESGNKLYNFFRHKAIIAALIGLLGCLIGKYGLPLIESGPLPVKLVREDLIPMSKEWQNALTGTWVGIEIQEEGLGSSPVEFAAELDIIAGEKHITGLYTAICTDPSPDLKDLKASFNVTGGFLHHRGRFLKLDYENRDVSVQGFGTILLVWTSKGTLEGRIIGFSAKFDAIAPATVQLRKKP